MPLVNKKAVAAAFGRAAKSYSYHNELQLQSARELRTLLGTNNFSTVLDAGCGPGGNSITWQASGSKVTAIDISLEMVSQARKQHAANTYLVADIEALPLLDAIFDLVWSHLAIQWCNSFRQALRELYRVARPGGIIAFTTLLNYSLIELRQAWLAVDTHSHANNFLSQTEVIETLTTWRYNYAVQRITLMFNDAFAAMQSLKGIGATYLYDGRLKKSLTRSDLRCLELAWPLYQGKFPLTYQLFHGIIYRE